MTIVRTPRPTLANVLSLIGPNQPTLDQRLCDALFDCSVRGRCHSPLILAEKASLRVADELENAVRRRLTRSQQAWRWKLSQRCSLAEEIRVSVFMQSNIDYLIHNHAGKLIRRAVWRTNERHFEYVEAISHEAPMEGATVWLLYCLKDANKATIKDRDIVKRSLYACWAVGYAVERWRELCSKVPLDARQLLGKPAKNRDF